MIPPQLAPISPDHHLEYLVRRGDSQVFVDPRPRMRGCLSSGRYPPSVVVNLGGPRGAGTGRRRVGGRRCGGQAAAGNTVTWFQRVTPRPYSSSPCTSDTHEFRLTKISQHSNKHARTHSESFGV